MSRREVLLAIAIAIGVVALRAPLLDLPLERDEGGYAYVAWRLSAGEMPYLDWFEQKPPGIFLAYRAALALPLDAVIAIRLVAALFSAATCVALFAMVSPLLGPVAATFSAALLGLLSADPMLQGPIANTEIFMLPGLVAATALFLRMQRGASVTLATSAGVGALLALATVFKPVAATNAPFFALALLVATPAPQRWRQLFRFLVGAALGGAAIWLTVIGWLASNGALEAAIDTVVLYNFEYAGQTPWVARRLAFLHNVGTFASSQGPAWALAGAGLLWLAARGARGHAAFLGGWLLFNLLGVSGTGYFFPHYFQQPLPAVAALTGAAALALPHERKGRRLARAGAVAATAMLPLLFGTLTIWRLSPEHAMARIYPGNPFEVMPGIARELESITQPGDRVLVFGAEPQILFTAQRVSASRYIYLYPLYVEDARVEERRAELIGQIEAAKPRAIVWIPNQMTRGRELEAWLARFAAASYRIHLLVVADGESRGKLLHVPEGEHPRSLLQGRKPWARLLVRKDEEDPPSATN